jgi:hypothetical protein
MSVEFRGNRMADCEVAGEANNQIVLHPLVDDVTAVGRPSAFFDSSVYQWFDHDAGHPARATHNE